MLRALSEDLITPDAAARLLGAGDPASTALLNNRCAFVQLPLGERRRRHGLLLEQTAGAYGDHPDRDLWQGDNIVEQEHCST